MIRNIFLSLGFVALVATGGGPTAQAQQVTLPRPSPHTVLTQTVGITEITVDYSRPQVKDREIWGQVVP
ncbi:MAG TPA: hypothetical protein DCR93_06830, partial [Cytophagales bacterium]|nr:hypothetical protein [Cytophagales bacterium]